MFRKQPSSETQYNNPCHTTGSLETSGQEEAREEASRENNSGTKLHNTNRSDWQRYPFLYVNQAKVFYSKEYHY